MKSNKLAVFLIAGVLLLVVPLFAQQFGNAWVRIIDIALLYVLLALGLNIVVGYAGLLHDQRQDQQPDGHHDELDDVVLLHALLPVQARSATRSPSRPCGRSVSTRISTMKAKMSW